MKGHPWTDKEIEILMDTYSDLPTKTIAIFLNMEVFRVYNKANKLGLHKSQEYLNSEQSGRLTCTRRNSVTQFKPGQAAWNKGMKGINFGGKETQFKPGHMPFNTKHDGYISIRHDKSGRKYKNIRIENAKWELLQRKIWADTYGPIPEGMVIAFKDGDTMNCQIENLEMLSYQENMIRNSIHRYPEEIVNTIRTITMLDRRIKKLASNE